jgi:hypothetical protein
MEHKNLDTLGLEMHQMFPNQMFMTIPVASIMLVILVGSGWRAVGVDQERAVMTRDFAKA